MGKSLVTGVDIGHHSIKAVVLKQSKGTYKLVGCHELPIESDIFTDNHMVNYQKIVKKLKELRKGLPLFSRKVSLAIPDNAVISKVLQIDSELDEQETEFAITQTFSHQSPFPTDELNLDYVLLNLDGISESGKSSFQVYATKKELVANRVEVLSKSGFQPVLVDVQAHCLNRVWQLAAQTYHKRDWVLLDVGFYQSSICMDFFDRSPFSKDISLGTRELTVPSNSIDSLHLKTERFIEQLLEKVQRNIQLLSSLHDANVEGIWLSGGGAQTPMLAEELTRKLQIECHYLNPFSLFAEPNSKRTSTTGRESAFVTAAGVAMRGLEWQEGTHVTQG